MKRVFTLESDQFINDISETAELEKRLPDDRLQECYREADEVRRVHHEIGVLSKMHGKVGFSRTGRVQRVASGIPAAVLSWITQVDPEFLKDKRRFYRWLDQHPEWDARLTPKLSA